MSFAPPSGMSQVRCPPEARRRSETTVWGAPGVADECPRRMANAQISDWSRVFENRRPISPRSVEVPHGRGLRRSLWSWLGAHTQRGPSGRGSHAVAAVRVWLTCCRVRFGDEVFGDVVRGWESREPAPTPTATMPTSDVEVRMSAVALCLVGARSPGQRSGSGRLGKDDRELFSRIGTSSPFRGGCRAARRRPGGAPRPRRGGLIRCHAGLR
jgi:hypothetical protein